MLRAPMVMAHVAAKKQATRCEWRHKQHGRLQLPEEPDMHLSIPVRVILVQVLEEMRRTTRPRSRHVTERAAIGHDCASKSGQNIKR